MKRERGSYTRHFQMPDASAFFVIECEHDIANFKYLLLVLFFYNKITRTIKSIVNTMLT